jgi:hypothetical protein
MNSENPDTNGITLPLLTEEDDQELKINNNNPKRAKRKISIMLQFIRATLYKLIRPDTHLTLMDINVLSQHLYFLHLRRKYNITTNSATSVKATTAGLIPHVEKTKAISLKTRIRQIDMTEWKPFLLTPNSTAQKVILWQIPDNNLYCLANILWALALREILTPGYYTSLKRTISQCPICSRYSKKQNN